jgi:hypothetical protein
MSRSRAGGRAKAGTIRSYHKTVPAEEKRTKNDERSQYIIENKGPGLQTKPNEPKTSERWITPCATLANPQRRAARA